MSSYEEERTGAHPLLTPASQASASTALRNQCLLVKPIPLLQIPVYSIFLEQSERTKINHYSQISLPIHSLYKLRIKLLLNLPLKK